MINPILGAIPQKDHALVDSICSNLSRKGLVLAASETEHTLPALTILPEYSALNPDLVSEQLKKERLKRRKR